MKYSQDWFSKNIPVWEQVLAEFKGKPVTAVELGSWEGRSAIWLLENILTNKQAKLHCVDTWEGGDEHSGIDMNAVLRRFDSNIDEVDKNYITVVHVSTTEEFFKENMKLKADIVYVDASHRACDVLSDAVFSHHILNPGGVIIFDDYMWEGLSKTPDIPRPAIDAFMECYAGQYQLLAIGYQVILRKHGEEKDSTPKS